MAIEVWSDFRVKGLTKVHFIEIFDDFFGDTFIQINQLGKRLKAFLEPSTPLI